MTSISETRLRLSAQERRRRGPARRRECSVLVSFVFLAAGVPLACPTSTLAASAPDSARISWVEFQLRHFEDVRIVTGGGQFATPSPSVSSDGLRLYSETGRWGIGSPRRLEARLVSWTEIESIQARKGGSRSSVALGAVAGLAIGFVIVMGDALSHAYTLETAEVSGTPILVGLVGGAALGALIGRPGPWQSVYPETSVVPPSGSK